MQNQFLQLHPISEAPPKDGYYWIVCKTPGLTTIEGAYFIGDKWQYPITSIVAGWLNAYTPVTGVLVSEEELSQIKKSAFKEGEIAAYNYAAGHTEEWGDF